MIKAMKLIFFASAITSKPKNEIKKEVIITDDALKNDDDFLITEKFFKKHPNLRKELIKEYVKFNEEIPKLNGRSI